MHLNAFQISAVRTYKQGEYAHLLAIDDANELGVAINNVDDNALHEFIRDLGELDPRVHTASQAVQVLRQSISNARDLEALVYRAA